VADSADVFVKEWKEQRATLANARPTRLKVADLPKDAAGLRRLVRAVLPEAAALEDDKLLALGTSLVSQALFALLVEQGFQVSTGPGEPFTFAKEAISIQAPSLIPKYS
jgi:hypothetical protein